MSSHATTSTQPPGMRADGARFGETHARQVRAPLDDVWRAALTVTAAEIRGLGPLATLRSLPSRFTRRGRVGRAAARAGRHRPLLATFENEGFVLVRRHDDGDDRSIEYGAVGRFWSLTDGDTVRFADADDFTRFDEPGYVRVRFELRAHGFGGHTDVTTTTCVSGTDAAAERRFAPYWTVIRLPSGLIRRSWLAAIERRARR